MHLLNFAGVKVDIKTFDWRNCRIKFQRKFQRNCIIKLIKSKTEFNFWEQITFMGIR